MRFHPQHPRRVPRRHPVPLIGLLISLFPREHELRTTSHVGSAAAMGEDLAAGFESAFDPDAPVPDLVDADAPPAPRT
jgi:hypothetical protein